VGFEVFCKNMRRVGMGKTIGRLLHWRTKESREVKAILDSNAAKESKRRAELADSLKLDGQRMPFGLHANLGPRPTRDQFTSYNKWQDGVARWQILKIVCRPCYSKLYSHPKLGSDGRFWKGNNKYNIRYDKERDGSVKLCENCGL
jgi:hypothetical protein